MSSLPLPDSETCRRHRQEAERLRLNYERHKIEQALRRKLMRQIIEAGYRTLAVRCIRMLAAHTRTWSAYRVRDEMMQMSSCENPGTVRVISGHSNGQLTGGNQPSAVRRAGKQSWELKFSVDGKPVYRSFKGSKRQAIAELTRLTASAIDGSYVDGNKLTVAAFLDRWIRDWCEVHNSPKTQQNNAQLI